MTASLVSAMVDASSGTADIATVIDTLSLGQHERVGAFVVGNKVRFYKYQVTS